MREIYSPDNERIGWTKRPVVYQKLDFQGKSVSQAISNHGLIWIHQMARKELSISISESEF